MDARYARNIPALTEEEWGVLQQKRVLVVGCGGLGGHLIDQLTRIGIGAIRAVDGDVFEPSNLNRQLLSKVSLLGISKAKTAAEHIHLVNPDIEAQCVEAFMTKDNVQALLADCDAVLDGLDNPESRKLLAAACASSNIPYIYGAISGWVAQAAISMPGDHLMELLYPEETVLGDKSVLSFTPALCAALQTSLCVKLLVGRPVNTGTIYYFDLLNQEFEIIPFNNR